LESGHGPRDLHLRRAGAGLLVRPRAARGRAVRLEKLNWINGEYIRLLDDEELARRLQPFLPKLDETTIRRAVPALKTRLAKLADATDLLEYLWTDPLRRTSIPIPSSGSALPPTRSRRVLGTRAYPRGIDGGRREIGPRRDKTFMPLRLAVTGKKISPPIDYTLALLPKDVAMSRLRRAIAKPQSAQS